MRRFFYFSAIVAVSNFCLKVIFPAKKLRKNTGAQNTHAPFDLFLIASFKLKGVINNKI